jgi:hypothetical protein
MTPAVENVRAVGTDEAGTGKKIWQSWIWQKTSLLCAQSAYGNLQIQNVAVNFFYNVSGYNVYPDVK